MTKSKDFVFKEIDNKLVFVGDFEGFYQATSDPWDQSAQSTMSDYYNASRERLCALLKSLNSIDSVIEVGCGLGYVTNFLSGKDRTETFIGKRISKHIVKHFTRIFTGEAVHSAYSMWLLRFMCGSIQDSMKTLKMHEYNISELEVK